MLCIYRKTYCCYDTVSNSLNFSSKDLNKWILEQSGDGFPEKYRKVLDDAVNNTLKNNSFRAKDNSVAIDEQTKWRFFKFYHNRFVEDDATPTRPLSL